MENWSKWFVLGKRISFYSAVISMMLVVLASWYMLSQRFAKSAEHIQESAKSTAYVVATAAAPLMWNFDTGALVEMQKSSRRGFVESISFFGKDEKPLIPVEELKKDYPTFVEVAPVSDKDGKPMGRVEVHYNKQQQWVEFVNDAKIIGGGIGLVIVAQILAAIGVWWANRKIFASLAALVARVRSSTEVSASKTSEFKSASERVRDAALAQSEAVDQTVSAISEIRSMMEKTLENVERSIETVGDGNRLAGEGQTAVGQMISAVNEITESNQQMFGKVEESNRQLNEIVRMITHISEKTKVINEIVFQTKLLSFNASVEAARAGEHGKGFAVVAEEVGNLARMSGQASAEIATLLGESVGRTESIVRDTTRNLGEAFTASRSKADQGVLIAQRCGEVLEKLVRQIGDLELRTNDVRSASNEQSAAIENIFRATNVIQGQSDRTLSDAKVAEASAEELSIETGELAGISRDLQTALGTDRAAA